VAGDDEFASVDCRKVRTRQRRLLIALIDRRPLILDALAHRFKAAIRDSEVLPFPTAEALLGNPSTYETVDLVVVSADPAQIASGETLSVLRQLCGTAPNKPVTIIIDCDEANSITAMMREGARGCIPTSCALRVAVAALDVVMAGGTFAPVGSLINARPPNAAMDRVARPSAAPDEPVETPARARPSGGANEGAALTARQIEVLACVAKGGSNKMIARELRLCEGTVKVHIRHLMAKLKAANRTQLALRSHAVLAGTSNRA
jgi:DNA-binding NarL/FixJ family response regulator